MVRDDPEGAEIGALKRVASFEGKDVLEVGCGDGRLTFQYADLAHRVVAFDPSRRAISEARKNTPRQLASKVEFRVGTGEKLPVATETFDRVFFSFSLCCTDMPAQGRSVMEAWRVLKPGGLLVNVMDSPYQPLYNGMVSYLMFRGAGQPDYALPERQGRLALKYATYVQRMFAFVKEVEFPYSRYYDDNREAMREIAKDNGAELSDLDGKTKFAIKDLLDSLKSKKGIRIQENAVLTVLRKTSEIPD